MSGHWAKLTSRKHGTPVYINLARALMIKADPSGSTIVISEDSSGGFEVRETPEQIFKAAKANA